MANGLKYGEQDIDALMFDAPIHGITSRYDFTGWSVNQNQPSDGITVVKNKVTITKFKPNEPIIISNFSGTGTNSTPTIAEICSLSKNLNIKVSGLSANNTAGLFSAYGKTNQIITFWTAYLVGAYLAPYNTSLNAEINVAVDVRGNIVYSDNTTCVLADDYVLRGDGGGYGRIGMISDRVSYTKDIPDWKSFPNSGTDHHWQLAFGIYTSVAPNSGDYITLTEPVVLQIENTYIVDPTTIEGYTAAVGEDGVYSKEMTYDNVLTSHDLSFKEVNTFTEPIAGFNAEITSNYGSEQKTAFVISERNYRSLYENMRLPAITNLGTLLRQSFPFKFWATLKRDPAHTHIWDSIVDAFTNNTITNTTFANHLFSKSSGDIPNLTLKFDVGTTNSQDNIIDLMGIFDHSNLVSNINFNLITGTVYSLVNAFRNTKTLQSLTFNKMISVSDWQGSFEGTSLANFPENVAAVDRWHTEKSLSGPDCIISDAADGCALTHFGNWKTDISSDPHGRLSATVTPNAVGTSSNVGSVTVDSTIGATQEITIVAEICPGGNVPDFDSQTYQIRRLKPYSANTQTADGIVFLLQGIGYDTNNNKVGASPTYIASRRNVLSEAFNPSAVFTAAGYTPDPLNTNVVKVGTSDFVTSVFGNPYFFREKDEFTLAAVFTPGYIEMEMTAVGLKRMEIQMRVFNINDTFTNSPDTYTVNSYSSTPYLYENTGYALTAWGITGRAYAMTNEYGITVSPSCRNAFYNSLISEIRYILDMKFVSPVYNSIGGSANNRLQYTVFSHSMLQTAYIKNLNKGDWSLDGEARADKNNELICGGNLSNFDEDSANFLLENMFDLRRNTKEASRIENEYNSFNSWTASGGSKYPISFHANGNASIRKSVTTTGKLVLDATISNCTVTVTTPSGSTTLAQGINEVSVSSFGNVIISVASTGSNPQAIINLSEHFLSELTSGLTQANVYLPESWRTRNIIHPTAVQTANERGWTVYVGGQVYTV